MAPRLRKPTGVPNWPLVLLEGPAQVGKSYQAAQFTGCDKVGQAYWFDLGEGAADEYAAVPGADYMVVAHDGTWQDIIHQLEECRDEAAKAAANGDKPSVLVLDSMSNEWDMLKGWTNVRARSSKYAKKMLESDPDAEIKASPNLWNDAGDRHHQLMNVVKSFNGIVIMTAKGKETIAVDADGRPIPKAKDYSVEGHKSLAFDANVWVRLSRDEPPMVVSFRSATRGIRPGVDTAIRYPDFTLERFIFDVMGLEAAQTRDVTELVSDELQLANTARAELGVFLREHKINYKAVAERFYQSQEEALEDTRDPSAIRNLLQALQEEQAKGAA